MNKKHLLKYSLKARKQLHIYLFCWLDGYQHVRELRIP